MVTNFTDWNSRDSLEHYGIRGMRWGERRFQNPDGSLTDLGRRRYGEVGGQRSALGTKHDLNKLDRERATAKARYDYYHGKSTKKLAKLTLKQKLAEQAGNVQKADKIGRKIAKTDATVGQKTRDYKALLDRNKRMTDRIISESVKKGYSIYSRDCARSVNRGRSIASNIIGMASAATIGIGVGYHAYAQGTHYRVRNNGLGIQTHRSRRWGRKHNGL